jgi:reverse transcriptase-like protein
VKVAQYNMRVRRPYLHYVFDLWTHRWRRRATGDAVVIRYADDTIVGFQHEHEAKAFLDDLKERLRAFELTLHPEKTRLIRFGRHAAKQRERRGEGKPKAFDFLGFTHFCTRSRKHGSFVIARRSRSACERRSRRSRWNCASDCTIPSRRPERECTACSRGT